MTIEDPHVVELCQDEKDGRYVRFRKLSAPPHSFVVFVSEPIPGHLAASRHLDEIQRSYKLSTGSGFVSGGHGEWFTDSEVESMRAYDRSQSKTICWATAKEPTFPPR